VNFGQRLAEARCRRGAVSELEQQLAAHRGQRAGGDRAPRLEK
jgi:hypothetical protein